MQLETCVGLLVEEGEECCLQALIIITGSGG